MVEKIKTNIDRLLLDFKLKKSSILAKYISTFFFMIETKSRIFMSGFIFSTIFQILKNKFYAF